MEYDVIIIGCGVTGAAAAYMLSKYRLNVAVLEAENDVAIGTSKANSAIIHAGYDPVPGTLMARLNVEGNKLVGEISEQLHVPISHCGSLVIAFSDSELEHLKKLYDRGIKNGVPELYLLDREETLKEEPNLSEEVCGSLYAKTASVISPWDLTLAMAEVAVKNGTDLFLNTKVNAITKEDGIFTVTAENGNTFKGKYIVNAAGVYSDVVHEMIGEKEFTVNPTKGEYCLLDKSEGTRVKHVIFQCPNELGKGVLVGPTVHGNLIVGPNAEPGTGRDDKANTSKALDFVKKTALRSVPSISFRENIRNFAGVRANTEFDEFLIGESKTVKGFLNLAGIKSPGLTASPAIGKYACELLETMGLELVEKDDFDNTREVIRFKELGAEEKNDLIKKDPRYGRVICRCETVTEGEIVASLHEVIPARSIAGVKRRCNAGMGRCQGGFCSPRVAAIIARELGIDETEIMEDRAESYVLIGKLKEGTNNV
ncbi:MAG: NAD(P)/FAD-dependent oxidoreductase [Oscillospiraceae bacterium]|nr:NAD(P)/FAD-dependent oxidoreductase [Oscillospiraceae bacterium]